MKLFFPLLTSIVFSSLLGAIVIGFIPKTKENVIKWTAAIFAAVPLVLSLIAWALFVPGKSGMQFVERFDWIKSIGVQYYMGIDGLSLPMVVLSALLTLLAVIASWHITLRIKEYMILLLVLNTGMIGVFTSLDYILFYVFWEIVLVPMYFLIGIWGGPRREYAAIKFFLYTLAGSVFMLLAILALYYYNPSGVQTFDMLALAGQKYPLDLQKILFLGLFVGFAIKVPVFPFHTWLPDAHVEAPTAVSVILAGVLLKMGGYGFFRVVIPTVPEGTKYFTSMLAILAIINIVYGAYLALAQTDLKKLVAYSSISHMGFILLGMAAGNVMAINGAVYQMVSHGLITGMLFFMVGMIYDRAHTREISAFGGLSSQIPLWGGIMSFTAMASLGLPGLSGFIGELLVFLGALQSKTIEMWIIVLALLGVVLTAGYLLWMIERVNMRTLPDKWKELLDLSPRELATVVPLIILVVLFGVYPPLLLNIINPAVVQVSNVLLK